LGDSRVMRHARYELCFRAATSVGVAGVLYLAAYGPVWSILVRFPQIAPVVGKIYEPVPQSVQAALLDLWCRVDKRIPRCPD
jgi:hypothetical protein